MKLNIYYNSKRLRDFVFQIDKNILTETTSEFGGGASIKGNVKGGLPKWLETIGFGGEASLEANGNVSSKKQKKFTDIDLKALDFIRREIEKNNYFTIEDKTSLMELKNAGIVRMIGDFTPIINGKNGVERVANFKTLDYIEWVDKKEKLEFRIGTSTDSFHYKTPLYQCLSMHSPKMRFDFFGMLTSIEELSNNKIINLMPLFIGVDFNEYN